MAAHMKILKLQQKNDFKEVHTKLQTSTVTYFFTQYSELVKRASWVVVASKLVNHFESDLDIMLKGEWIGHESIVWYQ